MSASKWHMVIVILSWVVFSLFQVIVKSELPVTICAIALCLVLLARREKGELMLYFFGLFMGIVVEVGLGQIARTQHWEFASFFGIPYWLPLLWGHAFVLIRRVGNGIVSLATTS